MRNIGHAALEIVRNPVRDRDDCIGEEPETLFQHQRQPILETGIGIFHLKISLPPRHHAKLLGEELLHDQRDHIGMGQSGNKCVWALAPQVSQQRKKARQRASRLQVYQPHAIRQQLEVWAFGLDEHHIHAQAALGKPFRQVQHNALCTAALERGHVYRYPAAHNLFLPVHVFHLNSP